MLNIRGPRRFTFIKDRYTEVIMYTNFATIQGYTRSFNIENKRPEKTGSDAAITEREKEKSTKPEEEEKRPGDIVVA
jgi:hypothetical protein